MADNTVAYSVIEQAKTIIMNSTTEIENTFRRMSSNISEDYASVSGGALSGEAGQAIANAWNELANKVTPEIKSKLNNLTDVKLTEWGRQFDLTEKDITQALNSFSQGI